MGAAWSSDLLGRLADPHYSVCLVAAFITGLFSGLLLHNRSGSLCRQCGELHRGGACAPTDATMAVPPRGEERCTICLEAVGAPEITVVLRCGHVFHYDCVAGWCRERRTCPVCRRKLGRWR